jgi:hypothetical protein
VVAEETGQVGPDVALAAPGEPRADDLLVGRVGGCAGGGEPLELVGVLDRAEHRQGAGHGHIPGLGQRLLQAQQVHGPGRVGDRVATVRVEQSRGGGVRVAAVGPVGQ